MQALVNLQHRLRVWWGAYSYHHWPDGNTTAVWEILLLGTSTFQRRWHLQCPRAHTNLSSYGLDKLDFGRQKRDER